MKDLTQDQFVARLVILVPNLSIEKATQWTELARKEGCIPHLVHNVAKAIVGKVGTFTEYRIKRLLKAYLHPSVMQTLPALNSLITWCADNYSWATADNAAGSTDEFWFVSRSLADYIWSGRPNQKLTASLSMRLAILSRPLM